MRHREAGWIYEVTMGALRHSREEAAVLSRLAPPGAILDLGAGPESHLLWVDGRRPRIASDRRSEYLQCLLAKDPRIVCLEGDVFELAPAWTHFRGLAAIWALYGLCHHSPTGEEVRLAMSGMAKSIGADGVVVVEVTDRDAFAAKYGERGRGSLGTFSHAHGRTRVWVEWQHRQSRRLTEYTFEVTTHEGHDLTFREQRSFLDLRVTDVVDLGKECGLSLKLDYSSLSGGTLPLSEEPRRVLVFERMHYPATSPDDR